MNPINFCFQKKMNGNQYSGRTYVQTAVILYAPSPFLNGGGIQNTNGFSVSPYGRLSVVSFRSRRPRTYIIKEEKFKLLSATLNISLNINDQMYKTISLFAIFSEGSSFQKNKNIAPAMGRTPPST